MSALAALLRQPRAKLAAGLIVLAAIATALALDGSGGRSARLVPGGAGAGGSFDPLSWSVGRSREFEAAAADGLSHVLYAKSPGGVLASAQRTAALRPRIETAAKAGPIDADTLEALVLLESAGRPEAIAGSDLSSAAGLTQILASTATGLLGLRVDLTQSRRLTAQIAASRGAGAAARLRARRAKVDQRFDPLAALSATERYLAVARRAFGRDDLAVESYHMGIGNLETAVRRFAGAAAGAGGVAGTVSNAALSYAKLYFESTPLNHAAAYSWISALGDDSATYYWRMLAAKQIMRLYRADPAGLRRQAALQNGAGSAEQVLRPPDITPSFADAPALAAARASGAVLAVPSGAAASKVGLRSDVLLHLRPDALAALLYTTVGVRAIIGGTSLLALTAATTDTADLRTAASASRGLADADPVHASGYAFDIARRYASPAQAQAFQFMLNRLQVLNLIAYQRTQRLIHVVAGPGAAKLRPVTALR
ncbi:MAG: transglycosylase SLT domain-containing protein [Solirubrobacteraceae bacterium]